MAVATYIGVVREGCIHLIEPAPLSEGSQVYVVVPAVVDERTAHRKANRWLMENIGNMVMADHPALIQSNRQTLWRFGAFITALSHEPLGPIGHVDVNAATGEVLADPRTAAEMIQHGKHFARPALSAES
jgi:hypothetical protein